MLGCDFDRRFIDRLVPFIDLTNENLNKERAKRKIKSIVVEMPGCSLDSVYLIDTKNFNSLISSAAWGHTNYNFIKKFEYDEFGILKFYAAYPVCKYLTTTDSALTNHWNYDYQRKGDSVCLKELIKDKVKREWKYYKEKLIYFYELEPIQVWVDDSNNKTRTSKEIGNEWNRTSYHYLTNGKVNEIMYKGNLLYKYDYPSKNKTLVTFYNYYWEYDTTWVLQNEIVTSDSGRLIENVFTNKGYNEPKVIYKPFYDGNGNLIRMTQFTEDRAVFKEPNLDREYKYKHTYKNNKLVETEIVNYQKFHFSPWKFLYNKNGLVETRFFPNHIEKIKYSFYN